MIEKKDFISVIVVAAGKGQRMNSSVKKQFILLQDKPIIYYSLKVFSKCDYIDEIVLVTSKEDIQYCQDLVHNEGLNKVTKVVEGGSTRQVSVFCGLSSVNQNTNIVLVHDGARPFVASLNLKALIDGCKATGCATFGVKVKDTIKVKDSNMEIQKTLDREKLIAIQTPQAFLYKHLWNAHVKVQNENYIGTDDTVLTERCGVPTKVVEGSYFNIKITTKEDLMFAKVISEELRLK